MARRKFFKKPPPRQKNVYTFVLVYKEEWPEEPTKSFLRNLIKKKIRVGDDAFSETWFFDVPKLPGTKIFRVNKKRNEISLCCTVLWDESLRLPTKPSFIELKPTQV